MNRTEGSEVGCEACHGAPAVFLWERDASKDGRWVINEAMTKKSQGVSGERSGDGCRCREN